MFESESGTAPGVQLSTIMDRMEIRKAVQTGQVEEAIDKVNDLNPEVGRVSSFLQEGFVIQGVPVGRQASTQRRAGNALGMGCGSQRPQLLPASVVQTVVRAPCAPLLAGV
jgi:hypothetical protein